MKIAGSACGGGFYRPMFDPRVKILTAMELGKKRGSQ